MYKYNCSKDWVKWFICKIKLFVVLMWVINCEDLNYNFDYNNFFFLNFV